MPLHIQTRATNHPIGFYSIFAIAMYFRPITFSFLCIAMMLLCSNAQAQTNAKYAGLGIESNLFTGKVIKHSSKFHLPVPSLSTGADVNCLFQTFGKKDWHQRRHFPLIGIGLTYVNYGIDSIYGRCIGLYPNITLPLLTLNKFEWTMRLGNGIGYVTKKYERIPIADTINNAIGSHVNDFFCFSSDLRWRKNDHWDVQAGINFNHISDASFRQPNLGINFIGYHVGVRYFPVTSHPTPIIKDLKKLPNRILIQVKGAMAFNQLLAPQGPLYPVYLASANINKRYSSKNKWFAGLDYSYHTGIYAFQRNNEINIGKEAANSYKLSVMGGHEFMLGRLGIGLQVGVYVKEAHLKQDKYYQKICANYYLRQSERGPIKECFLYGNLKTHKSVAEMAEFGVGIGF